jgi:hypothetical protein
VIVDLFKKLDEGIPHPRDYLRRSSSGPSSPQRNLRDRGN